MLWCWSVEYHHWDLFILMVWYTVPRGWCTHEYQCRQPGVNLRSPLELLNGSTSCGWTRCSHHLENLCAQVCAGRLQFVPSGYGCWWGGCGWCYYQNPIQTRHGSWAVGHVIMLSQEGVIRPHEQLMLSTGGSDGIYDAAMLKSTLSQIVHIAHDLAVIMVHGWQQLHWYMELTKLPLEHGKEPQDLAISSYNHPHPVSMRTSLDVTSRSPSLRVAMGYTRFTHPSFAAGIIWPMI